ncbi:MAG: hypothetical protein LBD21_09470 [Tannerellaceae bacterium]|jgi:hypothetical protein|nr:hypothetical protein [Tannerellaceae bacterium]
MKHFAILISFIILATAHTEAQQQTVSYKFYGFIRDELFYNSRKNAEGVDGLYHLYPLNRNPFGEGGKDLNAVPHGNFYAIASRVGVDISGPMVGAAKLTARMEADFTGSSSTPFILYLRQAFLKLTWSGGSSLQIGHAWHPLFGEVFPDVLDLSTGAPFQPFNRSPLIKYSFDKDKLSLSLAAIWQVSSLSPGPDGKSNAYIKNSLLPELFAGINYRSGGFLGGVGVEMLSLSPRTEASPTGSSSKFRVDERITTASLTAQAQYRRDKLFVAAKSLLASNLGHTSLLGGYGVSAVDPRTGQQDYTAQRHSTSWLDITYGSKWLGGLFLGYSKNLGTSKPLVGNAFYGTGYDIDRLLHLTATFTYNLPHWKAGFEYSATTAHYGAVSLTTGKVSPGDPVTGHRLLGVIMYTF